MNTYKILTDRLLTWTPEAQEKIIRVLDNMKKNKNTLEFHKSMGYIDYFIS